MQFIFKQKTILMVTGIVYMFENKTNEKKYIGKTTRPKERYNEHKRAGGVSLFHRAIKKYGFDNFKYIILEKRIFENKKQANAELDIVEKEYIEKYKTKERDFGYNLTDGGECGCGCIRNEETKRKMAISKIGDKNPMKRKEISKKVSIALKGRKGIPCSEEKKEKMRIRMKGERNPMYGKTGDLNPSFGIDWTKNISKEKYEKFCEKRSKYTLGNKNPMYGRKQNKSLWLLPDGSTKIMANCSVAAKHKDWIKIQCV